MLNVPNLECWLLNVPNLKCWMFLTWNVECWMLLTWNIMLNVPNLECWMFLAWNVECSQHGMLKMRNCLLQTDSGLLLTLFMPRSNKNKIHIKCTTKHQNRRWILKLERHKRGVVHHTPVRGDAVQNPNWQLVSLGLYARLVPIGLYVFG